MDDFEKSQNLVANKSAFITTMSLTPRQVIETVALATIISLILYFLQIDLRASKFEFCPNISTVNIALVFLFINLITFFGSRQKVSSSMSANTGIAFHCSIDVAVAHIVQGLTIISSPGSISSAPTAQIKPEVQEFTTIAFFTL